MKSVRYLKSSKKPVKKILITTLVIATSLFGVGYAVNVSAEEGLIPSWIKGTAEFWSNGSISDSEFISAIEFMIAKNIINLPEQTEQVQDNGDFYVTFEPNPSSTYDVTARDWIINTQYFDINVEFLNNTFKLPYDVEIVLKECGISNAFYDPETKKIILCYEFIDTTFSDFASYYERDLMMGSMTEVDISRMSLDTIDFIFYHELGHALVDIHQLPITGLEENAVDQFATSFMLLAEDSSVEGIIGQDILYNVGTWFLIQSELVEQSYFWDVHNLDIQRFYNISCYAYGQNPEYNQDLVVSGFLPKERAENCAYEYWLMEYSWEQILENYYI